MCQKTLKQVLREQVNLLAEWNEKNIEIPDEAEQVRRNLETICKVLVSLAAYPNIDNQIL